MLLLFAALCTTQSVAQTDETIFREFQFDFSTPGARANAMGRAFVGLADEATAAFSNPAGLSVLEKPELSFEYRYNRSHFQKILGNEAFRLVNEPETNLSFDLSKLGFLSYSLTHQGTNISLFYVNNLSYERELQENHLTRFENREFGPFSYINDHHVRGIELNTYGISFSRNYGKWNIGVAFNLAELSMDFSYKTSFSVGLLNISDLVESDASDVTRKPAYVFGALYQVTPDLKLGFSYKVQPRFTYTERVTNQRISESDMDITFKVPDSFQLGLGWQPGDRVTVLFDIDWVRYQQLLGSNLTQLASYNVVGSPISFAQDDYTIGDDPEIRLGFEYLLPIGKNILALRTGAFRDPDHKARFVGTAPEDAQYSLDIAYQLQDLLYNTEEEDNPGYTAGIGFVWKNKIQTDLAYVHSDRYKRAVCSFLYRF